MEELYLIRRIRWIFDRRVIEIPERGLMHPMEGAALQEISGVALR
jgi:hypothetical protein